MHPMNRCALVACVFVATLAGPSSGAAAEPAEPQNARVHILFGEYEASPPPTEEVQPDPPPVPTPAPVPTAPVVDPSVVNYILRTTPPDELIRYYFRDTSDTETMLRIARRESGLGKHGTAVPFDPACSADNPHSSAAGLFQTLAGWSGLASTLDPPVTWAEVAGPDCLGDVRLARAIYARSGLGPWQ